MYLKIKCIYNIILNFFSTTTSIPLQDSTSKKAKKQMKLTCAEQTKILTENDIKIYNGDIVNVERKRKLDKYRKQLQKLKDLPIIIQRTKEWYDARKLRLTASDLDEALSKNNLRLAKKKAGVIIDNTNYAVIPALKWGTMFEPMASRCYSQANNNIQIHEFGLIPDPKLEHFGASPDGINDMGIMIEIKCPFSREIVDNNIPYKYYMQIQGQLAVCCLEECDYIECDFTIAENVFNYIDEMFNTYQNPVINHGIIAEYKNKVTEEYKYLYSDPYLNAADAHINIQKQILEFNSLENGEYIFMKLTPWKLKKMNVQRVTFDEQLWNETVPRINSFWDKVEECKLLPTEEVIQKVKIAFIEDED